MRFEFYFEKKESGLPIYDLQKPFKTKIFLSNVVIIKNSVNVLSIISKIFEKGFEILSGFLQGKGVDF